MMGENWKGGAEKRGWQIRASEADAESGRISFLRLFCSFANSHNGYTHTHRMGFSPLQLHQDLW